MRRSDLNDVVTIHYLNGNCSWKIFFSQGERIFETDQGSGSQIQVEGEDVTRFYQVKCVVDGKVLLNATITAYGERLNSTTNYVHLGSFNNVFYFNFNFRY